MKAKDLTSQQRIEILEDVLRKLEGGDTHGGLCLKIKRSTFEIFEIFDDAEKIIPIFTLKNARKVTEVKAYENKGIYWWNYCENYDFENRIKFVKWMINEYK